MKNKLNYLVVTLFVAFSLNSQNLLDSSTWTIGSGGAPGFNAYSGPNIRELDANPFGITSVIWKSLSTGASPSAQGGWLSDYHDIDHTKTYRMSVWIKKTNSDSGTSYFGCYSYVGGSHHTLTLANHVKTNPYFLIGDLPETDKWYLVVGLIHGSNYNETISYGGIYDGTTGEKVRNVIDFKFKNTATKFYHRAFMRNSTNSSDEQFYFDPRFEQMNGNEPSIEDLLNPNGFDANLLDTFSWTEDCGSVSGFLMNGSENENCREIGKNHIGEEVILWKGGNDAQSNQDGGWDSDNVIASSSSSYRMSVWIKKTNSNSGTTYFGFKSLNGSVSHSLNLSGALNPNPYFFQWGLPKINRWYLLVGYVHHKDYNSTINIGRIYDGVTGEEVGNLTDFKLKSTATVLSHRAYLYYDANELDRQFFYSPRIDKIDGFEPTIDELLRINENSKLIISYDTAGNQKQNFYCEEEGFCSPSAPTSKKVKDNKIVVSKEDNPIEEEIQSEDIVTENKHTIYPNPTDGLVSIKLYGEDYFLEGSISIFNTNGSLIKKITLESSKKDFQLNLEDFSSGVYFIHMHFSNGKTVTEQIIKK